MESLQTNMGEGAPNITSSVFENSWFTVKIREDKAVSPLVIVTLLKAVHLFAHTSANVLNLGSRWSKNSSPSSSCRSLQQPTEPAAEPLPS